MNLKTYLTKIATFHPDQEIIRGSIHFDGNHANMLPPETDQKWTINAQDLINPTQFSDWGESLGTYEINLKPMLDYISKCWNDQQTNALTSPPWYLKPWRGLSPHPFPDPSTPCYEITVPPTHEYYIPMDNSEPIEIALSRVNCDEKAKVEKELDEGETIQKLPCDDQRVARMLEKGNDFKGRGIVRLIITHDYNWYCISLFHNYNEGPDHRCTFFPKAPLPLWTNNRRKL